MDSGDKKRMAATDSTATTQRDGGETTLRSYEPPRLRHLGSVRELTLGPTGSSSDVGAGRKDRHSSIEVKENVHYLTTDEKTAVANAVLGLKLATYDYKPGVGEPAGKHLGFIIEDAPKAPFVRADDKVVDVYGLATALAAVVQQQQVTISRLETELAELKAKLPA